MNTRRLFQWMAVLIMAAALLFSSPGLVWAEGDAPEGAPPATPGEVTLGVSGGAILELPLPEAAEEETGAPLVKRPAASQAVLLVLDEADPFFKIGGVTYMFTTVDCDPGGGAPSPCSNPIQAAINYLVANHKVPDGGLITVEAGMYMISAPATTPAPNINIDGAGWTVKPAMLILKGAGSSAVSGSTIAGSITIEDMKSITLQGFRIGGNVTLSGNSGMAVLRDLDVSNSSGNGISIILHSGNALVEGVDASFNTHEGLYAQLTSPGGTVTVKNSSFGKNVWGMYILSKGNVVFNNVSASGNNGVGAHIETSAGNGGVTVIGSVFSNNGTVGLDIASGGAVSLKWVTAGSNDSGGATVDNSAAATPRPVNISASQFSSNDSNGLTVHSKGLITLNNVLASSNNPLGGALGARIDNDIAGTSAGVTLLNTLGSNQFNNNGSGGGLLIYSKGAVTVNGTLAQENSGTGMVIENDSGSGSVTLRSSDASGNTLKGVSIVSHGRVVIDRLTASRNTGGSGAYILNEAAGLPPVLVTRSIFNHNSVEGLVVYSTGTITVNNIQASYNSSPAGAGMELSNIPGATPVLVLGSLGESVFEGNAGAGMDVSSRGMITVSKVRSDRNGGSGALLSNEVNAYRNVTINSSIFNLNGISGLAVRSQAVITVNNVQANSNTSLGAHLNSGGADPDLYRTVVVLKSRFDSNGSHGLLIETLGNVTLNGVSASENVGAAYDGARIDASGGHGSVTVVSTLGQNTFNNNGRYGLYVATMGRVTVSGAAADRNSNCGIIIKALGGLSPTTVSNVAVNENFNWGLQVVSDGAITVTNISAQGNFYGASLDNNAFTNTAGKPITVNRGRFGTNFLGLEVKSYNDVVLNNVIANANTIGVEINNASGTGKVTVLSSLGGNHFDANKLRGLSISTKGVVLLSKVAASGNGFSNAVGVYINSGTSPVTVLCGIFNSNWQSGLRTEQGATSLLTLKGVTMIGNGLDGIHGDLMTSTGNILVVPLACGMW